MKRYFLFFAGFAALFAALTTGVPAATTIYNAQQSVSNEEMLRWIYNIPFPPQCPDANQAVRDLRFKPVDDPATMHKVKKAMLDCANTAWAKGHAGLQNSAYFAAAASSLIAARKESPPSQALKDAQFAQKVSGELVSFTHQTNNPRNSDINPSVYRTNAGRMNTDAKALVAALQAMPAGAAPANH